MTLNQSRQRRQREEQPLFEYVCKGCGSKIGVFVEIKGARCNKCGQNMVKMLPVSLQDGGLKNDKQ